MTVSIAALRVMVAAGASAEMMLAVLEADYAAAAVARSRDAARKRVSRMSAGHSRTQPDIADAQQPAAQGSSPDTQDDVPKDESLPPEKESASDQKEKSPYNPLKEKPSLQEALSLGIEGSEEVTGDARARPQRNVPVDGWPQDFEALFWDLYPHKIGKGAALLALRRVRRGRVDWTELIAALRRYVAKTDDRPWCNPSTWLNQHRWTDQPAPQPKTNGNGHGYAQQGNGHRRNAARRAEELAYEFTGPDFESG